MILPLFKPARHTISGDACGREITGFYVGNDDRVARVRFSDSTALLINPDRTFKHVEANVFSEWLTIPGWVRVANVIEDENQIIFVVSGAIYTSRISFRKCGERWQLAFTGGRIF